MAESKERPSDVGAQLDHAMHRDNGRRRHPAGHQYQQQHTPSGPQGRGQHGGNSGGGQQEKAGTGAQGGRKQQVHGTHSTIVVSSEVSGLQLKSPAGVEAITTTEAPMKQSDYLSCDATALAELIRRGEVSSREVVEAAVTRAEKVNGRLNAICCPQFREALVQSFPKDGTFAGVPLLLKDLAQEQAGYPCTAGSRALQANVPEQDSEFVARARRAGLVFLGRTTTPEFGLKAVTESELWGPSRNPWDTAVTPGGSSGGSGAAVGAGIVPMAGANDGGGSIRIPAAYNGLFGLKPSRAGFRWARIWAKPGPGPQPIMWCRARCVTVPPCWMCSQARPWATLFVCLCRNSRSWARCRSHRVRSGSACLRTPPMAPRWRPNASRRWKTRRDYWKVWAIRWSTPSPRWMAWRSRAAIWRCILAKFPL